MSEFASYAEVQAEPVKFAKYWHGQIKAAKEARKGWCEDYKSAIDLYTTKTPSQFNILFSNVQTRCSARYNSTPVPDVRPQYMDGDNQPVKAAARLVERALMQQLDAFNFDNAIKSAVLSDELIGQGQVRVMWDEDSYEEIDTDPTTGEEVPHTVVRRENAIPRYVPPGYYLEGPANTWEEVPWVAFKVYLSREDMLGMQVDMARVEDLTFGHKPPGSGGGEDKGRGEDGEVGYECCWQVWDKRSRSVIVLSEDYAEDVLHVDGEPVPRLPGFFPCPEPLMQIEPPMGRIPVCPFNLYREQAEALGEITKRIDKLVRIMRYRGFRAAEVDDLIALENLDDGEFAPTTSALALVGPGGDLNKLIWSVPIADIVAVLRELVNIREALKQTIYEVTGLSDVMRGASDPSETATAQQIKSQFGSLRIQDDQRKVQRFVRDVMRLMGDIITTHFADETLAKIDGVTEQDPQGMETHRAAVAFLRSDEQRYYRVDIETDSTIVGDLRAAQEQSAAFLAAAAQFGQVFIPMIQQFQLPPEPFLKLFQSVAGKFKLGKQAELAVDELLELVQQQQQQNPPEVQQQKRQEAEDMQRQGQMLGLQEQAGKAQKAQAEAEGQMIENQMQAQFGPMQQMGGFVA